MTTPRHALGAALLDGLAHFPGGSDQPGVHPVTVDETLQP
jgi:hypothetical protein